MKRREFIALAAVVVVTWPFVAEAQQHPPPTIGFLGSFSPIGFDPFLAGFKQGLTETGYVEGQNVTIEYRWANNQFEKLPALAAELINLKPNVLVAAGGEPVAMAVKTATSTIPVVFSALDDPVRLGIVASFNRPGGNMTGMSIFNNVINAKRMELLHELVPGAKSIGLLISSNVPDIKNQVTEAEKAAEQIGLELHILDATREEDFDPAFAKAVSMQVGAMIVHPTAFVMSRRFKLVAAAKQYGLPTIYPGRPFVEAGGLICYGIDFVDVYRQAGKYSGRILKGESVSDLPVQQPSKFDFAFNR